MTPGAVRGFLAVAALAVGLLVGTLGAFLQASRMFVAGFAVPWGTVLVLLCLVLQLAALTWYSLSYIPFARQAVSGVLSWATGDTG